ncbi:hypothetical protein CORC01_00332 [Colletotrichum orchidophilum]|uniref:Uncharacterized protein n=1 Tax=Colletotrichum orchidophilum TaxID=1209926 RepID=A0A1G4BSU9_9PEZI|nr:uncharacterized protein CORC01_00332 [Colletotrichum orchidophilum]OHF04480.1 hypothetical protein CORC01_00332 [Colletotrichum orchidophilum]
MKPSVSLALTLAAAAAATVKGHIAAWADGMYRRECCRELSPFPAGQFLNLPAWGKSTNYTTAAGMASAVSYQSDIKKVTMENLVVFSVVEQYIDLSDAKPQQLTISERSTPWKRVTSYHVPFLPGALWVVTTAPGSGFQMAARKPSLVTCLGVLA